jgi:cbb3-type cytochrome oxidase cytochrome c subunit
MAATDKNYRNQYLLDVVFAVSSLVMLVSVVWMFADDYYRPYKTEQRDFRQVESTLAQRLAIEQLPNEEEFRAKEKAFADAKAAYESEGTQQKLRELRAEVAKLQPKRERADARYQSVKADLESVTSFYNIATEANNTPDAKKYAEEMIRLGAQLQQAAAERDAIVSEMKSYQVQVDAIEDPMTKAQSAWKKVTDKFDTQVKLAYYKQWGWGDWFRALPIIDAFASPVKIQQITNNDIPIDYNFKLVTRFDRCTTCHLGIDRPAYTKENLLGLTKVTPEEEKRLEEARKLLKERSDAFKGLPEASKLPTADQLKLTTVSESVLTPSRISEYAAHPRLDLFVGANSKHPMEKFGCSACHYGQGSATEFTLAAHTPNAAPDKERWVKQHDWESQHMWDFPMLPQRFIESSCLKCHAEVTDLISSDNRVEAPKLLNGYNLIKEFGCFGCHEIAGTKGGRVIGPDLRLEPNPPLEDLTPTERTKLESDPENPPGTLRKVGPSLYRVSEKTNPAWATRWIRSPRGFRPDTKMPHFYGLSNNHPDVLPEDQKKFPDAEINSVAYYLFQASDQYLRDVAAQHKADEQNPQAAQEDERKLGDLLAKGKDKLNAEEKKEFAAIRQRDRLRREKGLVDQAPNHPGDPTEGRRLFSERGCLACHSHDGTREAQGTKGAKDYVPAVKSDRQFGPNLSQVGAKLGRTEGDKKSARVWLIQWIMDPHVHSPRSRMPVTHLTADQAADIAAWLLSQPPQDLGEEWNELTVPEPDQKELENLASVYLVRLLPQSDIDTLFKTGKISPAAKGELPSEEREFAEQFTGGGSKIDSLKRFLGKKAVGRLGCFACHDVPGFDNAKNIGVGLNDWGKKDPGRLAFDNIDNFVEAHFAKKPLPVDEKTGKPYPPDVVKEGGHDVKKMPYEQFYWDELFHRQRIGFLNQKIIDPRSYDYGMKRAWDDRYRMPQFRFARSHKKAGESDADFEARAWKDEADAREAVMTFILGLVAEQVPLKMVNQPQGDRLMEVRGRQVLEKYNCAGCHLLRPGAYDLTLSAASEKELTDAYEFAQQQTKSQGMHVFPNHHFWTGRNPAAPDRVVVPGVQPKLLKKEEDEDDENAPYVKLQVILAAALRFPGGNGQNGDKTLLDIPSSTKLQLALEDLIPGVKTVKSPEELHRLLGAKWPLGGTFSDMMVKYLAAKDPDVVRLNVDGDSGQARAMLPPPLYGEGERVQPQWLFQFLLDPQPVRRMSILRMPKFNMSREEAKTLVGYFAAVERITNPGIGLTYPEEVIPQQGSLTDPYWQSKTRLYLERLKSGGPEKGKAWYDLRLKEYEGSWKQAAKLAEAAVQADIELAKQQREENNKQLDALKEKIKKTTDAKEKADLEKEAKAREDGAGAADEAIKKLQAALKQKGPDAFQKEWQQDQALATDTFRLIANRKVCLQCHQIGAFPASNPVTQGPPLELAHDRLRPGWVYRWVAIPQRHVFYESVMPPYFPRPVAGKPAEYQTILTGMPHEQIEAVRDTLMNWPRIFALPVNQQWNPDIQNIQNVNVGEKK